MNKPIALDLPYPGTEGITADPEAARIISPAYAAAHSELTAILQYIYHHFNFQSLGDEEIASTLIGISVAEMRHLEILGETLSKLGVDPVFTRMPPYKCDFYSSSFVTYSKTAKKMIMDNISGELLAISDYKDMLARLKNEEVAAIISRIILDEELHVKVLKEILAGLC